MPEPARRGANGHHRSSTELRVRLDGTAVVKPRYTGFIERETQKFAELTAGMTREELLAYKGTLEQEMASIRTQLQNAHEHRAETQEFASRRWYNSAQTALRLRGLHCAFICQRLGELRADRLAKAKREQEPERERELRLFVRVTKERLDSTAYLSIWDEVNRRRALERAEPTDAQAYLPK